ncbi:MAG: U6 snRNA-associated Sm-like protein LSm6 [Desulfurococcales archaeon]|nr:U6 snRNA-associated Sm-like protein LSm6 [Desulfurococcales archaeon]
MAVEGRLVNPLRYLRDAVNTQIYVRLKDGSEYMGTLIMTDSTMNLVLDDTVELRGGGKRIVAKIGKAMIRGSMIQYISFNPDIAAEEALTS